MIVKIFNNHVLWAQPIGVDAGHKTDRGPWRCPPLAVEGLVVEWGQSQSRGQEGRGRAGADLKDSGKWLFTEQSGSISVFQAHITLPVLTVDCDYQLNYADMGIEVQGDK